MINCKIKSRHFRIINRTSTLQEQLYAVNTKQLFQPYLLHCIQLNNPKARHVPNCKMNNTTLANLFSANMASYETFKSKKYLLSICVLLAICSRLLLTEFKIANFICGESLNVSRIHFTSLSFDYG